MKRLMALALLIAPTEALATTWKEAGRSDDNLTIAWVDTDSIKVGKDTTFAWWRLKLSGGDYTMQLSSFKCGVKAVMDLQMTYYKRGGGNFDMGSRLKGEWYFAPPDSVMSAVVDAVCGERW